ncbi:ion transporter [Alginatibacterium sediminis]|uniref:Ion transporter n=1 Tax=Alginatibacterium sediminis TaxID=2164068 RepID=A0A420ECM3_9ALTE|nr:potassium channel family protein [Alginatibacterium sediminis]RKF18447.1 ion transporter [Alginatibacterium sediminis]
MSKKQSAMDVVMFLLSIVAIIIVIASYLVDDDIELWQLLIALDTMICLIFMSHFFGQLLSSESKWDYLKSHWIDFVASIPIIGATRFLRVFLIVRMFRIYRRQQARHKIDNNVRDMTAAGVLLMVAMVIILGSVAILIAEEHNPASKINTGIDALWWSLVTVSTVGYGDLYPVSTFGRIVGGILICAGVGTFGILSGLVSSMVLKTNKRAEHRLEELMHFQSKQNKLLIKEIQELRAMVNNPSSTEKKQESES